MTFKHHNTIETLKTSVAMGCIICTSLTNELNELRERRELEFAAENEDIGIQAGLSELKDRDNLALRKEAADLAEIPSMFQLEFELQKIQPLLRTFALKATSEYILSFTQGLIPAGPSPQVQLSV